MGNTQYKLLEVNEEALKLIQYFKIPVKYDGEKYEIQISKYLYLFLEFEDNLLSRLVIYQPQKKSIRHRYLCLEDIEPEKSEQFLINIKLLTTQQITFKKFKSRIKQI